MPKITKKFIENEIDHPASGQRFYRDDDLPGFAVRVTQKAKSYVLEKRSDGVTRRITIGKCSSMTVEDARKKARVMLGSYAGGKDPVTGKTISQFENITLREVLQKFFEVKPLRRDTLRNYYYAVNNYFKDWLDMPITSITKEMVEERHHLLTVSPNRLGTSGHGRANNALKKLSALINFASDRYGTEDEPLIKVNPVSRLSRNRAWHKIHPRQRIIPDHKLKDWYQAVVTLQHAVARDFMIFLLFTGMRFGETRKLRWNHVDFTERILIVPRELTKSDREHRLPLSDFLMDMLEKRRLMYGKSEWVFQSTQLQHKHLSEGIGIVRKVRKKSGIYFTMHDLRRTFLTMGEKLNVPIYVLKRLVNHNVANDMTGKYLVLDMERLRFHMAAINNAFLELLEITKDEINSNLHMYSVATNHHRFQNCTKR